MPSPFPGMNPYLEQPDAWEDFHDRFIVFVAGALEAEVGSNYVVKIETRRYVHELGDEERRFFRRRAGGLRARAPPRAKGGGPAGLGGPRHVGVHPGGYLRGGAL